MSCRLVERDLDAYVDRELEPDAVAALREHLAVCPGCRGRVEEREALGRLLRSTPYYAAPDRLRARVSIQTPRAFPTHRLVAWAAAAALILSVAGGLTRVGWPLVRGDAAVEEVVTGHVRSLMANHLLDVESTDQHTVKPWFLGKLDFSPPVTDLSSIGFPLVGGRLDYLDGRPVAALVYQRQKHAINVFVSPAPPGSRLTDIDQRTLRGFHVQHWTRDGMSFWAVSDLNEVELAGFSRALRGS